MDNIGLRTLLGFAGAAIVIGILSPFPEFVTPTSVVRITAAGGAIGFVGDFLETLAR